MMMEEDDANPSKWSYYFELAKNKDIKEAADNQPVLNLVHSIIEMIKEDKVPKAQDIRDIGKVVKAKGENAQEAMEGMLSGDLTIAEAKDLVQEETKLASLQKKADNFLDFVKREMSNIKKYRTDPNFNYTVKQIIHLLDSSGY